MPETVGSSASALIERLKKELSDAKKLAEEEKKKRKDRKALPQEKVSYYDGEVEGYFQPGSKRVLALISKPPDIIGSMRHPDQCEGSDP